MIIRNRKEEAVDAVLNVKKKAIGDFDHWVKRMQKGYQDDYSHILTEIMFIENACNIDKIRGIYERIMLL